MVVKPALESTLHRKSVFSSRRRTGAEVKVKLLETVLTSPINAVILSEARVLESVERRIPILTQALFELLSVAKTPDLQ